MNKVYLFLIILLCFSNLLAIKQENSSSYSLLLGSIRREIVDNALTSLPKKQNINLLKMLLTMKKTKESYNLTDAESAFFSYEWIGRNIIVNYSIGKNDYEENVYKRGEGSPWGISKLFIFICNYLSIKSKSIEGYVKMPSYNSSLDLTSKNESSWNYIVIDDLNFLVDASLGIGLYTANESLKEYSDLFFATKPEIFINYHFPNDINWQLLPQPISMEKFDSLPFIYNNFYLLGFKNFYPDYFDIKSNQEIKIELTYEQYDQLLEGTSLNRALFDGTYLSTFENDKTVNSNGKFEITLTEFYNKLLYLIIYANNPIYNIDLVPIIIYKLIP